MADRRWALLAVLTLTSLGVLAEAPKPMPILLDFPSSIEAKPPAYGMYASGLIANWAASYRNKHTAARIKRFHDWLPDYSFEAKVRTALSCALRDAASACRSEESFPTTPEQMQQMLANNQGGHGLIIKVQPLLGLKSYLLHVSAVEAELKDGKLSPVRVFTALYASRVPDSLESVSDKVEEPFKQYWTGAAPSALGLAADSSVSEAVKMLEALYGGLTPDGRNPPEWAKLPKLDALKTADRVHCSGMPCGGARVFKDGPDGLWLAFVPNRITSGTLPPDVGSALASLDANAAKWNANMWVLATAFDDN